MSTPFTPLPPARGPQPVSAAVRAKWDALRDAAAAIATMADVGAEVKAEARPAEAGDFTRELARAEGWRRNLAESGIDDLVAAMEPGIAALLAARSRGEDARPQALALWREIETARDAIQSLVIPPEVPETDEARPRNHTAID